MYSFEFERPASIDEAVAALSVSGAQALAGGQTLIPTLKNRLASPSVLVSVSAIPELKGVSVSGGAVVVGAAATHAEVAEAAADGFPALAYLAGNIGDPAVRNRGTVGGSIANNDPSACYPAAALATGATIVTNSRRIGADDFFIDIFETVLEEGELITSVEFPIPDAANYQKFEQPASRFALVGAFVSRFDTGARVAITGAADSGAFRWTDVEEALDNEFSAAAVADLSVDVDGMIADIHGSQAYRAHLVRVMTRRAVEACQ
ncbi:MAG: FAD binding domain-containing protein [Rhodobacteraceae bacterium]|nr:FAD binding domain-containing protein [Paracoccaceae bacterium]